MICLYSIYFHFTLFLLDVFFRPFRPYKYAWKAFYLRFKAVVYHYGCTFRNIHRHFNIAYSRDSYQWLYASFLSVMTGLTRMMEYCYSRHYFQISWRQRRMVRESETGRFIFLVRSHERGQGRGRGYFNKISFSSSY